MGEMLKPLSPYITAGKMKFVHLFQICQIIQCSLSRILGQHIIHSYQETSTNRTRIFNSLCGTHTRKFHVL